MKARPIRITTGMNVCDTVHEQIYGEWMHTPVTTSTHIHTCTYKQTYRHAYIHACIHTTRQLKRTFYSGLDGDRGDLLDDVSG